MIFKRTFAAAAILAGSAIAANAADLPTIPGSPPPPPPMAAPAFDWSGMYFGASGAFYFGGFEVGAHVGYNMTRGSLLFGGEASVLYFIGAVNPISVQAEGRVGYVLGQRALLYANAGAGFVIGGTFYFEVGGGLEFAVGQNISLFAEGNFLGGGAFNVRAGLNVHR
jgi:opacity protein-like surface antigen